jgi:hypothetical protein
MAALIGERSWWNVSEILRRDYCSLVAVASSTHGAGAGAGTVLGGIRNDAKKSIRKKPITTPTPPPHLAPFPCPRPPAA